jgi:hypothetical protein
LGTATALANPNELQEQCFNKLLREYEDALRHPTSLNEQQDVRDALDAYLSALGVSGEARGAIYYGYTNEILKKNFGTGK